MRKIQRRFSIDMLAQIEMTIRTGSGFPAFTFAQPVTLYTFIIAAKNDGEVMWEVSPASMQPFRAARARFKAIPLADADSEFFERVHNAANAARASDLPLRAITYGEIPEGYRQRQDAMQLQGGATYNVIMIAKEGHATATFIAGSEPAS
jgi:hypothetical protein